MPVMADEQPTTSPPPPRRFLRPREGRVVGGVAAGLARALGVDPLVVRLGFVVAAFFGGAGVLAYVLALLFVPEEQADGTAAPVEWTAGRVAQAAGATLLTVAVLALFSDGFGLDPFFGGNLIGLAILAALAYGASRALTRSDGRIPTLGRVVAFALLAVAILTAALFAALGSLWLSATGGNVAVAIAVVALGGTAVAASFVRPAPLLAVAAAVLAIPAALVAAADLDLDGGTGERSFRPADAADVRPEYRLGVGELVVDLRDTKWPASGVLRTRVSLGIGHALVLVPEGVCADVTGAVGAGYVGVLDQETGGVDLDGLDIGTGTRSGVPRLEVEADLGLGAVEVLHTRIEHDRGRRKPDRAVTDVRFAGSATPACAQERA
jgi:phage shock protein PspC (stress-responsive transcriptional regulator)